MVKLKIVDEHGKEVADGEVGEIVVQSGPRHDRLSQPS